MSKEKNHEQPDPEKETTTAQAEMPSGEDTVAEQPDDNTADEKETSEEEQLDPEYTSADERTGKLEKEVLEYRDKLIRKAAEFENYKKRTAEEYTRLINTAGENTILKILPVLDDLERMQKNTQKSASVDDINKGVDLILSKFKSILAGCGLVEIPVIGEEFNPDLHEALMQMENPEFAPNKIIDQHEKGYNLNGKVIRHSKVLVAK